MFTFFACCMAFLAGAIIGAYVQAEAPNLTAKITATVKGWFSA